MTVLYTGKSADGSDAKEVLPVRNHDLSTAPFSETKGEVKERRIRRRIERALSGKTTVREEYQLILQKKSKLPKACRDYIVALIDEFDEKYGKNG